MNHVRIQEIYSLRRNQYATQKKAALVIIATLFCAGTAHADATQQITLNLSSGGYLASQVTTDYILTIPDDFNINTNGWNKIGQLNVKVSQDKVFTGNAVVVTAESTNSFSMKDGDNSISYTLKTKETDDSETTTFTFKSADINSSASGSSQDLGISTTWDKTQPTGTYTDTITYTAAVEGAAIQWNTVDLSGIEQAYTAQHGDMLTGKLNSNVQISIAAGATIMLSGVDITGTHNDNYTWAGITCEGTATIILAGTNTVKGFHESYPGIFISPDSTLTIKGDGELTASSNSVGAGIGGGNGIACGNIVIEGGIINATGGNSAAGIGGGKNASCGTITITGGTIKATGGQYAAGIGCGDGSSASCGDITITSGVTSVTATAGQNADSIGKGDDSTYTGKLTIEDGAKVTQN